MPDSDSGVASGVPMDVTQSLGSQSPGVIPGQQQHGTPGRVGNNSDVGDNSFSHNNGSKQSMVKYGELIILGYNGQLPQGRYYAFPIRVLQIKFWFLWLKWLKFNIPSKMK